MTPGPAGALRRQARGGVAPGGAVGRESFGSLRAGEISTDGTRRRRLARATA